VSDGIPSPARASVRGRREPVAGWPDARVYLDGTALSRYLDGSSCREQWLTWAQQREDTFVVTPLGMTELRSVARVHGHRARGLADDLEQRLDIVRFSDQTLRAATKVTAVLPPFLALHLGAALAHPDVTTVATYDARLARVAVLYGLDVVSPGWVGRWWEDDPTPW